MQLRLSSWEFECGCGLFEILLKVVAFPITQLSSDEEEMEEEEVIPVKSKKSKASRSKKKAPVILDSGNKPSLVGS